MTTNKPDHHVDPGDPGRTPYGTGRLGNPQGSAVTWGPARDNATPDGSDALPAALYQEDGS